MPKLPKQAIRAKGEDGAEFKADSEASVTTDGLFRVKVPVELRDIVNNFSNRKGGIVRTDWNIYFHGKSYKPQEAEWSVEAARLDICLRVLNAAAADFLVCEKKTERVILYALELSVSFWATPDGQIFPNGYTGSPDEEIKKGRWYEIRSKRQSFHATNPIPDTFKIGLGAEAWDKTTYTRASGAKVTWDKVTAEDRFNPKTPLAKLQAFSVLQIGPTTPGVREMPYSDAAALWFHDAMISLFKVAKNMDDFFASEDNLLAIQNGTAHLLLSPPVPTRRQLQLQAAQ